VKTSYGSQHDSVVCVVIKDLGVTVNAFIAIPTKGIAASVPKKVRLFIREEYQKLSGIATFYILENLQDIK
jgi:hypothetical protein